MARYASLARLRLDPGCDRGQIEAIMHGCVRYHWLDLDLALLEAYRVRSAQV